MITIATPIITQQANGSFAENTNEIDQYKIAASYHERVRNEKSYENNGKFIGGHVTAESINL